MRKINSGSALLTVLIFSAVMTGLILSVMETHLISRKISDHFYDRLVAFEAAEAGLLAGEASIQHLSFINPFSFVQVDMQIALLDEDRCHKKRYQILSRAEYHRAVVNLESVYEYLPHPVGECLKEEIDRRVYWGNS